MIPFRIKICFVHSGFFQKNMNTEIKKKKGKISKTESFHM